MKLEDYKLTAEAVELLKSAEEEATSLEHNFVGTEHLFLAMLSNENYFGCEILLSLGCDAEIIKKEFLKHFTSTEPKSVSKSRTLTPRLKRVLDWAWKEAQSLGNESCDTGHLLISIVREGDGRAATFLKALGITTEKVRSEYIHLASQSKKISVTDLNFVLTILRLPHSEETATLKHMIQSYTLYWLSEEGSDLLTSKELRDELDDVVEKADKKSIIELCSKIYNLMPSGKVNPRATREKIQEILSKTTVGTKKNRNFGTLLQMMCGAPSIDIKVNYEAMW